MACIRKINCVWGPFFLSLVLVGESHVATPAFVKTNNAQFVLNGSSFLFNGFNSYWMMTVAADPKQRFKISNVFAQASAAGLRVCRTWAFSDGNDHLALQKSPGVYDENTFQALDFVVSEAGRYNVKLIMSLLNNFPNFGGKPQYMQWARNAGVQVTSDDDFFTNAVIKGYYKNHVKRVLKRVNTITKIAYREDPTVMAWELMNEPRTNDSGNGKILDGWIQEMASYVKSIDDKHLLGVGLEGFYGDQSPDRKQYNPGNYTVGTDFITNHLVKEIDYTTIHAYPDIWLEGQSDKSRMDFLRRWLTIHWNDSTNILRKPLIFEEFGKSTKEPGVNIQGRDSFLNDVYSYIYNYARRGGTMAGGLVWQIMGENMESYYDGFDIVLPQSPSTTNVIHQQSTKMTALEHPLK